MPERRVCVHISGEDCVWYVCDVLYAVLYVHASCFVVRVCAVLRRYIDVCNSDVFSVVNVYIDHLKFCVVCINGRMYVCCSECNVVSDECDEPTLALCNLSVRMVLRLCTFAVFALGELASLYCYDICMCVVNEQFELHEFVFVSVYVDLQYDEISLICTAWSECLCDVCSRVVVFGLSARLPSYPM